MKKVGDISRKFMKRSCPKDKLLIDEKKITFNNNNNEEFYSETKRTFINEYGGGDGSGKRELISDDEGFRQFPWKRIAYIMILLVLGMTCAILTLMKVFGGADWMNTGTFSVIIMGTVMLLPPGLYYGRILLCICCRCKDYSLRDVPAGPFG